MKSMTVKRGVAMLKGIVVFLLFVLIKIAYNYVYTITGNLIADAMVDYHVNFTHASGTWAPAAIAVINSGGIRASINKGKC